jgi:hypothetical protein
MEMTDYEAEVVKEIYAANQNGYINSNQALAELERLIKGEEPLERTCVGLYCGERIDNDIWKEELGMCVEHSNAYYTHEEEKEETNE